jgi:hypothetical protein
VAEALWACNQANSCACENTPDPTTHCPGPDGDVVCADFLGGGATLPACCPSSQGTGGSGTNASACGLDLRDYFRNARQCEPRAQGDKPKGTLLGSCPDFTILGAPYNGVKLSGCCHSADNTCGVFDDITGLGCLSSGVFGIEAGACPLL